MPLPINIQQLLNGKVVEWERLDLKRGWNPEDVMHSVCAFANDIHNWGGGYIVVGVEENNGVPALPPIGLNLYEIDRIQKDLVSICNQIQPQVNVLTEPVEYMNKMIFVIYVPGGEVRPYKAPISLGKENAKAGKVFYVREGSVTKQANQEEERLLMGLCNKVPFDDRICQTASIEDLDRMIIEDFLKRVGSNMTHEDIMQMPMSELGWNLQIIGGVPEDLHPKNVGLLLFSQNPETYIPYARIEIVRFLDDVGDRFEEKILHGPIHLQLEAALKYIQEQVIVEKVMKVKNDAKAVRRYNYPYSALEEIIANAVFHKTWNDRNPIEIRINQESIEVLNFEGPMPPITNSDLQKQKVTSRNYRNRRIGDFLKELEMTEGRSTGFPKIYRAIAQNDSPKPIFETDAHNAHFFVTLPVHPAFIDEKQYLASIGKELDDGEQVNCTKDCTKELSERQLAILELIRLSATITLPEIADCLSTGIRTIKSEIKRLRDLGILNREGGRKEGKWIILIDDNE